MLFTFSLSDLAHHSGCKILTDTSFDEWQFRDFLEGHALVLSENYLYSWLPNGRTINTVVNSRTHNSLLGTYHDGAVPQTNEHFKFVKSIFEAGKQVARDYFPDTSSLDWINYETIENYNNIPFIFYFNEIGMFDKTYLNFRLETSPRHVQVFKNFIVLPLTANWLECELGGPFVGFLVIQKKLFNMAGHQAGIAICCDPYNITHVGNFRVIKHLRDTHDAVKSELHIIPMKSKRFNKLDCMNPDYKRTRNLPIFYEKTFPVNRTRSYPLETFTMNRRTKPYPLKVKPDYYYEYAWDDSDPEHLS